MPLALASVMYIPTMEWEAAISPGKNSILKPHNLPWQLFLVYFIIENQRYVMKSRKEGNHTSFLAKSGLSKWIGRVTNFWDKLQILPVPVGYSIIFIDFGIWTYGNSLLWYFVLQISVGKCKIPCYTKKWGSVHPG